jgi:transcriptional regulator with XRE-family HTH domain
MLTPPQLPIANPVAATDKAYYQQLGRRIAERRKALGMNQTQLADLLGVAQQTMAHYEGGVARVAVAMLPTLCEALGLSLEELLGVEAKKAAKPAPKKRGPTPRIQQQIEAVRALPRSKQRFVSQVLDSVLAQTSR